MGGMIAQTIAIEHPQKARSLTSIMSATGDPNDFTPTDEALAALLSEPLTKRDQIIKQMLKHPKSLLDLFGINHMLRKWQKRAMTEAFIQMALGFSWEP